MDNKKRASVLAVGNELLLGQIVNTNAARISETLLNYNIRVATHMVVADDIQKIVSALTYLWDKVDILFVTGGLGPTEDDLTREAVAQFLKRPLNQEEQVLKDLRVKLQKRGVQFTLNHIKQAQFPNGSEVMKNDVGTADGFHIYASAKDIFVLPGPWNEIQSCWQNHIHNKLVGVSLQKIQLERFQIIGLPESEISNKVQNILLGSPFQAEYRIHHPFVEVRLDIDPLNTSQWATYAERIEKEFESYLVGKGDVDKMKEFVEKIKTKKVLFVDAASGGYIAERLLPLTKGLEFDFFQIASLPAAYAAENYDMFFEIHPINEEEWEGSINNTKRIPIRRMSQRSIRSDILVKKFSEIFFWRVLEQL